MDMTETTRTNPSYEEMAQMLADERRARIEAEQRIELLTAELRLARHKRFAPSREKVAEGQIEMSLDLDNEVEAIAAQDDAEGESVTITYKRRKASGKRARTLDDSDLEEVVEEIEIPEGERVCGCCGGKLHDIGYECRTTLEFVPAAYVKLVKRIHKYACRCCERENRPQSIVRAPAEPSLVAGSFASPSIVAHVMAEKFVRHTPLDRQEKSMAYDRVYLSKQTMSNWLVTCTDLYLVPVFELLREELVRCGVVHADETPVKILHPKADGNAPPPRKGGGPAPSSCYMWTYRTAPCFDHPISLYDHRPSRRGECARDFLRGFSGYLQTDGFDGYNKVPGAVRVGCWAHARRKFHEAYVAKGTKEYKLALEGLAMCDKLFALEREFSKMTPEERLEARREKSAPVVNAMARWIAEVRPAVRPKSNLGEALTYALNEWPTLTVFLEDGRLELSNNAAERNVRPVAVGRKNWLFSNSMDGAKTSATIFSIVETAKANGLNPEAYLRFLLETVPSTPLSELPKLLPWGESVPESVRAGKRPGSR